MLVVLHIRTEPPHDKTSNGAVRPAKTQTSLGIRPVWSESSLSAWRKLGSLATHWAHSADSDQTGRMPRLICVFAGRTATLLVLSCCGSNRFQALVTVAYTDSYRCIQRKFIVNRAGTLHHLPFRNRCTIEFSEMGQLCLDSRLKSGLDLIANLNICLFKVFVFFFGLKFRVMPFYHLTHLFQYWFIFTLKQYHRTQQKQKKSALHDDGSAQFLIIQNVCIVSSLSQYILFKYSWLL